MNVKKILKNLFTTKVGEHIPSGFSKSTIALFKSIENKHDEHKAKDCMKKICKSLTKHVNKIINFEKKNKRLIKE